MLKWIALFGNKIGVAYTRVWDNFIQIVFSRCFSSMILITWWEKFRINLTTDLLHVGVTKNATSEVQIIKLISLVDKVNERDCFCFAQFKWHPFCKRKGFTFQLWMSTLSTFITKKAINEKFKKYIRIKVLSSFSHDFHSLIVMSNFNNQHPLWVACVNKCGMEFF